MTDSVKAATKSVYGESFFEVIEDVYVHDHSLKAGDKLRAVDSHYPVGRPELKLVPLGTDAPVGWVSDGWVQRFLREHKVATGGAS